MLIAENARSKIKYIDLQTNERYSRLGLKQVSRADVNRANVRKDLVHLLVDDLYNGLRANGTANQKAGE